MALHGTRSPFRWSGVRPAAVAASLLLTAASMAQSGHRVMVVDDGAGPNYFHVSMPDLPALREPDFVRSDLPLFGKKLRLDEPQHTRVAELLEGYLEAFALLTTEYLPTEGPMHLALHDHGADDAGADVFVEQLGGPGDGPGAWLHGDEGPGMVAITVEAGGPGLGGGGGGTEDIDVGIDTDADGASHASVRIAVQGRDGEEMPEEQRKALEARAREIAERIQTQMDEAAARGEAPPDMIPPRERIETRMRELEEFAARAEEFDTEKRHLRTRFVEQVQSELTDDQIGRWPALERTLVRKKTLPKGRLDGERTDLVQVLEQVAPETLETPAVAEQVDAYELVLHDALVRRNAFVEEANRKVDEAIQSGEADKAVPIVDRATQLRIAVRAVNERYTEAIAQALDDVAGDEFRRTVLERSYPRVYRTTLALRVFEAARRLEDLDEERLLRILELEGQYRRELELTNTQFRKAIDTWEPDRPRRSIESVARATSGDTMFLDEGNEENPVRAAAAKRAALGRRYVRSLHDLLTPAEIAALPELPSPDRGPILIEHSTIQ